MKMITDTFVEPKENGEEGLQHKREAVEREGWGIVSIEEGMIPQAGSAVPGAPNFGMMEPGWIIRVQRPDPHSAGKRARSRRPLDHPSEWGWQEEPDSEPKPTPSTRWLWDD